MWCGVSMNSFYYVNAQYRPAYRDNPCSSMVYRWRRQLVFCCECELAGFFPADETDLHSTLTTIAIRDDSKVLEIREKKVSMKIARFLEIVVYFSPLPFFMKSSFFFSPKTPISVLSFICIIFI